MILGVVLAGGASRRFGSDKARALLDGKPLIAHAADALAPHVSAIAIAGASFGDYAQIADRPHAGMGPLGGLCGALHHAAANGFDAVLSCPCDTPRLPADALRRLAAKGGAALLCNLPVCGFWPAALADALDRHLASSADLSMRRWAATIGALWLDSDAPILNINTRAELDALERKPT